jgi:predicted flavoprotein YhiN
MNRSCDVLVLGGRAAGLFAVSTAWQASARMLLVEHAPKVHRAPTLGIPGGRTNGRLQ